MDDQVAQTIQQEEQNAMKAAAEENVQELRKEDGEVVEEDDDEVVLPPSKPERLSAGSTPTSNGNIKKEAPEMNIQLQR
jgi:hypothetical protein